MNSMNSQGNSDNAEITVLLIDDNQVNNKLVASILMPQAYNIYIADSGKAGIRMAHELLPDIILLDIMMPEFDGFQVCRHLQEDPHTREIPIIFITADSSVKTQTDAFQLGGSDFITKPIVDVVLIERIKNQIRLSRNKKQLKMLNHYHELAEELTYTGFWAYSDIMGKEEFTFSGQLAQILELDNHGGPGDKFRPSSITDLLKKSKDSITRKEFYSKWTQCLAGGGVFDEVCNCRIGKQTKYLRIRAQFTREGEDKFTGFGAVQDVSRIISAENELAVLKAGLEEFSSKQHLVEANTQLAHELNQPLAAINLNINFVKQLLNNGSPDMSAVKDTLQDIGGDVNRATNIVRNIRRLIKKEPATVSKFDLHELLAETVYVFNREVLQKNIELLFDRPDKPCIVSFDRTSLQQVIVNIVKNAIEAIATAEIEDATIEIVTECKPGSKSVTICDNGPGISENDRDHIFQQYFTSKKDNTGMGLAICKALMTELDGDIRLADPPEGYKTCFKVIVPG